MRIDLDFLAFAFVLPAIASDIEELTPLNVAGSSGRLFTYPAAVQCGNAAYLDKPDVRVISAVHVGDKRHSDMALARSRAACAAVVAALHEGGEGLKLESSTSADFIFYVWTSQENLHRMAVHAELSNDKELQQVEAKIARVEVLSQEEWARAFAHLRQN